MDEFACPWCGEDLLSLLASMAPTSYDAVYEVHMESCEPARREFFPEEFNYKSPLCDEEE